jgi:hypothetical protein
MLLIISNNGDLNTQARAGPHESFDEQSGESKLEGRSCFDLSRAKT